MLILMGGCDDRATQIAREAANRQAQQNTSMAELNQQVAGGTRRLVEADAKARQDFVGVHRDLGAERLRLDAGWNSLENERQQIAGQRRTESMLVPLTELVGGLAVVVTLLGYCWYALVAARRNKGTDAELNEFLVCELLPGEQLLPPTNAQLPALRRPSRPDHTSDE
jgi:hypothetical protein